MPRVKASQPIAHAAHDAVCTAATAEREGRLSAPSEIDPARTGVVKTERLGFVACDQRWNLRARMGES
eukprot:scaffold3197_cov105-Isochrysis_galbana.AAC.3